MNIEYDLKEVLLKLDNKIDKLDQKMGKLDEKFDKLSADINQIKVDAARNTAEIKGGIKTLNEKIDGISKRVDTQKFINRGVIVGLILAILGGFAKLFGFVT